MLWLAVLGVLGLLVTGGSVREPADHVPVFGERARVDSGTVHYRFAVVPLHNAVRRSEVYQPALDAINARASGFALTLETDRDYLRYGAPLAGGDR